MSAAVQQMPAGTGGTIKMGEALLAGRIIGARSISTQAGKAWLTLIKLPAPDEFASPQTIEVRSETKLGAPGEDVRCKVRIGGYGRSYKRTDDDTGEISQVKTADIRLQVVE